MSSVESLIHTLLHTTCGRPTQDVVGMLEVKAITVLVTSVEAGLETVVMVGLVEAPGTWCVIVAERSI